MVLLVIVRLNGSNWDRMSNQICLDLNFSLFRDSVWVPVGLEFVILRRVCSDV